MLNLQPCISEVFLGSLEQFFSRWVRTMMESKYHLYLCESTCNMSTQNLSLWTHKQINIFMGIQKEFITAIFDTLASPTNLSCHLSSNSSLLLSRSRFDTLLEKNKLHTTLWVSRVLKYPKKSLKHYSFWDAHGGVR